jgi:hypothetical protein
LLSLAGEAARLGRRAREEGQSSDQRRTCTREGRRESAVGGLGAPVRGRVRGSRPSGASARLREGGWEGVGRRGPRCACAREGWRVSGYSARLREGRRESATASASGGAPARVPLVLAAAAKIRDRVVWLGRWAPGQWVKYSVMTHEDVGWAENYTLVGFSSGFGSDPRVRN